MSADRATEPAARRKFWGWGREDEGLTVSEVDQLGHTFAKQFDIQDVHPQEPPRVDQLNLPAPKLTPPTSLKAAFSDDPYPGVLFEAPGPASLTNQGGTRR